MFPLGDDRAPGGPAPLVTVSLVILNVLVFLFELSQPSGALQSFNSAWASSRGVQARPRHCPDDSRCLSGARSSRRCSCTAGWMHLGGNMLYLWIFGDNLEKTMGHMRFSVFSTSPAASPAGLAHIFFSGASNVPTVGPSARSAACSAGYIVLFPRNQVRSSHEVESWRYPRLPYWASGS